MIAKLTSKNQITLPKEIVSQFPGTQYFAVAAEYDRIVLEPVVPTGLSAVREKMEELGIDDTDVAKALKWSRRK